MRSALAALVGLAVLAGPLAAHHPGERTEGRSAPPAGQVPTQRSAPNDNALQVLLITIGEGEYYWEKFGHNALWFRDTTQNIDVAYNWGVFNFEEPGFLRRLLLGDMQYWVEGVPSPLLIDYYRRSDRTITIQRLNLTPQQARKAFDYAQWNAREENKFYRYDYFRDNCSTRVRDLIDLALGGGLKRATGGDRLPATYRSETLRLVDDMKLTQFGIDVALGRPSDRRLSTWESMFVPSRLQAGIRDLRVTDSAGTARPVLSEERTIYESRTHAERSSAPRLRVAYLIAGLVVAGLFAATSIAGRRNATLDKLFRVEVAVWSLVLGTLGVVVLLAWLVSRHEFWFMNENLLLLNPLSVFLAVLAVLSLARPRWTRPAAIAAAIVAMLGSIALLLKALPGSQDNVPLVLLLLPTHFAIAHALWRRAGAPASAPGSTRPV